MCYFGESSNGDFMREYVNQNHVVVADHFIATRCFHKTLKFKDVALIFQVFRGVRVSVSIWFD